MTKRPILIVAANLVIVALLSLTAYILIGTSSKESSQTDVRSSASSKKTIISQTPVASKNNLVNETQKNVNESVDDIDTIVKDIDSINTALPELNQGDFE